MVSCLVTSVWESICGLNNGDSKSAFAPFAGGVENQKGSNENRHARGVKSCGYAASPEWEGQCAFSWWRITQPSLAS